MVVPPIHPNQDNFSIETYGDLGIPHFRNPPHQQVFPSQIFWHFPCLELQKAQLLASKECHGNERKNGSSHWISHGPMGMQMDGVSDAKSGPVRQGENRPALPIV
jgi:hypothetical protein